MIDKEAKAPRRRRKVIRSCTFCRKRKLKCDHGKPMCRQCIDRKLPRCIYTDDFNFQLTTDELFGDSPNVELIERVRELESKLTVANYNGNVNKEITPPTSVATDFSSSGKGSVSYGSSSIGGSCNNNPLWEYRIFSNSDGQGIIFGPTSWRTTVAAQGERFQLEYKKLWELIKPERERWMVQNCVGCFLSPSESFFSTTEHDTLINSVCKHLPCYKDMKDAVNEFFDDYLHDILNILDKDKVLRDFERSIIASTESFVGFGQPVIDLVAPDSDGNFYKVAVILIIVCIVKLKGNVPPVVDKFFLSLSALNTASKLNFVERAQFLLLRYFSKVYCSYDCADAPQLANLVAELTECSLNLGLSNVDWWYKDQEQIVGRLYTLRNMWYWTLYADIMVSFEMGKPLFISNDHFDPSLTFSSNLMRTTSDPVVAKNLETDAIEANNKDIENRRKTLLLEFLKVGRQCMIEVNSRTASGNIELSINELNTFVEKFFFPMKFYTRKDMLRTVDIFDVVLLTPILGMLFNFHNIQRMCLKLNTITVKNGLCKFGLLSLSVCVNTILCMFNKDKGGEHSPKIDRVTPLTDLNFALLLINSLLMRVLSEMYALFFFKLSLFEKGVVISVDQGISDINLDDKEVPSNDYYSFNAVTGKFREILDQLFDPSRSELQKTIGQSYPLTTTLALERVSRTLFDKGCESRTMTENSCNFLTEEAISQETLDQMTSSFWINYEQQSQDLWSMKPQDFYTDFGSNFDFDLNLK